MAGKSKAAVEAYARGLQDAGAPVNITYPGMILGPPAAISSVRRPKVSAAIKMRASPAVTQPGRSSTFATWPSCTPRCCSREGAAPVYGREADPGGSPGVVVGDSRRTEDEGVSDTRRRPARAGTGIRRGGDKLPFETPVNSAAMQYYTQMPASDDSPSERDFDSPNAIRQRS